MYDHRHMIVWQKARAVVLGVVRISRAGWRPWLGAAFSQLQRSALSVQLNISEGYALWHPKLRRRHLRIAYGSSVETVDLLELLREVDIVNGTKVDEMIATEREVSRMLLSWLKKTEPREP